MKAQGTLGTPGGVISGNMHHAALWALIMDSNKGNHGSLPARVILPRTPDFKLLVAGLDEVSQTVHAYEYERIKIAMTCYPAGSPQLLCSNPYYVHSLLTHELWI
jgi:hypothetical protein